MDFQGKNLQQSCHLNLFKNKNIYIRKFQCTSLINSSFDEFFFLKKKIDITLTFFLSPHFSFFLCDKRSVVISKVHYKSIIS